MLLELHRCTPSRHMGGIPVQLRSFVNSALGGDYSASHPDCFAPGERAPGRFGQFGKEKNGLPLRKIPPGLPPSIQVTILTVLSRVYKSNRYSTTSDYKPVGLYASHYPCACYVSHQSRPVTCSARTDDCFTYTTNGFPQDASPDGGVKTDGHAHNGYDSNVYVIRLRLVRGWRRAADRSGKERPWPVEGTTARVAAGKESHNGHSVQPWNVPCQALRAAAH
jgi:hypothetical protein